MTRVLFLAESFHPVLGGGETHVLRLGAALVAAGDTATVVTRRGEGSWPAEEVVSGIRVVRVPPPGPGRSGKFLMVPGALRAIRREAPRHDVVVVRGTRILGLPGLLAARALGLAVVMQPETNGELSGEAWTWGKPWGGGPAGRVARRLFASRNLWLRDAEAFVAMSRAIGDEMLAAGIPRERVFVLPHGVDTARFRPAEPAERSQLRARLGIPDEGVLAAWTGRLLRGKGLETLLEAFALVAREAPGLRLLLVGSGEGQALSIEDGLRRRAGERDLAGRVLFAGRLERVEDALRAADLFAFPSVFEGLGISLVEAAACGLPAVASRTGGIVDVVEDGRSGLLVRPGDAEALARGLGDLAARADRAAMGREARRVALERFDERDGVERYRALFGEVTLRRPSSSRPGRAPRAGGGSPPSPASRA